MIVNVILQLVYVTKFFWWEGGYYSTIDIMQDCAGFYLCWGCLVWVPTVYTITSTFLAYNPEMNVSPHIMLGVLLVGLVAVYINYSIDDQRGYIRETKAKTKIWGYLPEYIKAEYKTGDGQIRESMLITSHWWGVARHHHYVWELLAALCWTLPCQFEKHSPVGYIYLFQLTCILMHRIFRDEDKCKKKYGKYYEKYCQVVPYRLIPGIFWIHNHSWNKNKLFWI